MKKEYLWGAAAFAVVFFTLNIYLFFEKPNLFKRTHVIQKTVPVHKEDFTETISRLGIVEAPSEEKIYRDQTLGEVETILVKEGQQVQAGETLLQYSSRDIAAEREELELTRDQLEGEISNLETQVSDLEEESSGSSYTASIGTGSSLSETDSEENTGLSKLLLAEKEYQKSQLELQLSQTEKRLNLLDSLTETKTIKSRTAGIVKQISDDPERPVITIISAPFHIKGEANEKELLKLAEGQPAIVTSNALPDQKFTGMVSALGTMPEDEPEIDKETQYPFFVNLDSTAEQLKYGYHVNIKVLTEEHKDAAALKKSAILRKTGGKHYAFAIKKGTLDQRKLKLGMKNEVSEEVISGMEVGEFSAARPSSAFRDGDHIVMPLNSKAINKKSFGILPKKKIASLMIDGFLK